MEKLAFCQLIACAEVNKSLQYLWNVFSLLSFVIETFPRHPCLVGFSLGEFLLQASLANTFFLWSLNHLAYFYPTVKMQKLNIDLSILLVYSHISIYISMCVNSFLPGLSSWKLVLYFCIYHCITLKRWQPFNLLTTAKKALKACQGKGWTL